ncbi:surface-adhesin E family protein [Chryseobacterium sp. GP-SGM7]|uniref:surface-adhesin E family protein n=1 Tax=Chryseobacterium sp. GP-SGM7 TaxID=3411323 RepID=UPI003B956094
MKKLLFILLLCPVVLFAQEDWEFVGTSANDTQYFIRDVSAKTNSTKIKFWVKSVQSDKDSKRQNNQKPGDYSLSKWEGDCDEETTQTKIMVIYNRDGEVKSSSTGPFEETPIIPDTMGEKVLKAACNKFSN